MKRWRAISHVSHARLELLHVAKAAVLNLLIDEALLALLFQSLDLLADMTTNVVAGEKCHGLVMLRLS